MSEMSAEAAVAEIQKRERYTIGMSKVYKQANQKYGQQEVAHNKRRNQLLDRHKVTYLEGTVETALEMMHGIQAAAEYRQDLSLGVRNAYITATTSTTASSIFTSTISTTPTTSDSIDSERPTFLSLYKDIRAVWNNLQGGTTTSTLGKNVKEATRLANDDPTNVAALVTLHHQIVGSEHYNLKHRKVEAGIVRSRAGKGSNSKFVCERVVAVLDGTPIQCQRGFSRGDALTRHLNSSSSCI